ncbi:restriction endonuclease subunit S [Pseudomonas sp. NPDC077382]
MSFLPYPAYKDSGTEWLGRVPDHWIKTSIKHVVAINMGQSPSSDDCNIDGVGVPFLQGNGEFGLKYPTPKQYCPVARKVADAGDLLFSVRAPVGALNEADQTYGIGRGLCAVKASMKISKQFLWHFLSSSQSFLDSISTGSTFEAVSAEQVENIAMALPREIGEQTQIARFLDHETARIDALIEEQQRLIELLKEKRQAVISHAVTKGLDPTVSMKDSGVEWLGEVPAHWERKRLKNISPFITVGIVVNPSDYVAEEGLPFIYGGEVKEGLIEVDKARKISLKDSLRNRKTMLEAGDIVTMRVGYPGLTAVVPPECEGGNCASVMLVKRGGFDSRWLCAVMNSRLVRQQVEVVQYGAAQKQFNIADAIEFWMFKPPLNEQATIAEFVEEQSSIFDDLTAESENSMVLLQERRSALISAAVTGKIDVRGWQPPASAPTPELVEEAV